MARSKAFDPDDVLDAAQQCFELRGFKATSVDDLVHCTGLSRASLYNSFGDKHRLFEAVLDRYQAREDERVRARLEKADSPREAIRMLLLESADSKLGCLVMNAGIELGPCDAAMKRRAARALAGGTITFHGLLLATRWGHDAESLASILTAAYLGLRVMARTGTSRKEIAAVAGCALDRILPLP